MTKEAQHSIEKVLGSYFNKKEISEYKRLLKGKPSKAEKVSSLSNLNKKQLSSEIPQGSEFHYSANLLITFAKDKLEDIKFAEFLIHLGNTAIVQGEFSSAEQILAILTKLVTGRNDLHFMLMDYIF